MFLRFVGRHLICALACLAAVPASAHIIYLGHDFGTISGTPQTKTISNQTVETNYGWADGTDDDWASAHYQAYFKFNLTVPTTISITVTTSDSNFAPGFSLYKGVGTASPPDYDEDNITVDYLISLGAPAREGAFDALHTWKIGNETDNTFADMTTFTYVGNAADGTAANYGPALAINGDGVRDGLVTAFFNIPAGAYTIAIGGAQYFNQTDAAYHTFTTTLAVVPEPTSLGMMIGGLFFLGTMRRRARTRV